MRRPLLAVVLAAAALFLDALPVPAQTNTGGASEVFAGSVLESYLRYLQTAGKSASYPFGIRGFSPAEIDRLAPKDTQHPWARRYSLGSGTQSGFRWDVVRPALSLNVNSAFPFGGNDGPVWNGRGLTTSVRMGIAARYGAFSAVLAPVAFRAENQSIALMPNGATGRLRFADGGFPTAVDRPQTFGTQPYMRLDPGESTIRVDFLGATAGISTASQWWGPTSEFSPILGNNAGGFAHVFLGTSSPASIGFASLHGRVVYGYLEQSAWSPVTGSTYWVNSTETGTRRFMAGLVGLMQVRGLPGLEIGGTRFFHAANLRGGLSSHNLRLPFLGLLKNRLPVEADTAFGETRGVKENQLASVFVRIAPPGSGFDLYGEFAREDHSADLRDFLLEPDHASMSNVGFRKAWLSPTVMSALRAEFFTYEAPGGVQTREMGEGGVYIHSVLKQGHTQRGQLLSADVGPGSGNAQILAFDRFTTRGRVTGYARRVVAHESAEPDVLNTLGGEMTRFVGPVDVTVQGSLTFDLNRNLQSDKTNVGLGVSVRYGAW
ncbi:MAG: capsule assembly Wzi family protein [Gemmatimonadaceae bacterium]|nr:capsule assembly Wzi family protein [Gemmatimonadaceae bacterium]